MSQYILDMLVNTAELNQELQKLKNPFWLSFNADGCQNTYSTPQVKAPNPSFNFGFRMMLTLPELSNAYLYVNFCAFHASANQNVVLGNSRVSIKTLPVGYPKKFCFPIMSTRNTAIVAAKLNLTATLSAFVPMAGLYNSHPQYQPSGGQTSGPPPPQQVHQYYSGI